MRQFGTIATNTFMELVRQPIFLLLTTASAVFCVFLASVPYFGFGDDPILVKQSVLAIMLLAGLLGAVLSASNTLAREIRSGTALSVLAKPVGRASFLLAKYTGLAAALAVLNYVNMIAALIASRIAFDAYGSADLRALGIFFGALVLAYALGGFANYFLRRPFVSDALFAVVILTTLAFLIVNALPKQDMNSEAGGATDWRIIPASVLILFALWILAGLALACSTRLEMISTLAICSGFFVLGLMSDYVFGTRVRDGSWWANIPYAALPNWQLFWGGDALISSKPIPWGRYIGASLAYTVCYIGAALSVALCLFEDRELG
jgi:ABC-type transport system involved in multi-copper enzyme maturation permease subunit